MASPPNASTGDELLADEEALDFEDAKRIIMSAITRCLDKDIDAALVSAVLIGAGVSWYGKYHGEEAILQVLNETITDIRTGRHRVERWAQ